MASAVRVFCSGRVDLAFTLESPVDQTTIRADTDQMTLINVFTVDPERQQELVDLLVDATERKMSQVPGFISASIHRSDDGRRVINYAQWRSRADFAAMQQDPEARSHMARAAQLAQFDPIVCEVAYVHHT
jgi:heme-degrading monooxygenase HmoA